MSGKPPLSEATPEGPPEISPEILLKAARKCLTAAGPDVSGSDLEENYRIRWLPAVACALRQPEYGPALVALLGGMLASEPALLFIGGYQGTMRKCFPQLFSATSSAPASTPFSANEWTVFAVSEDRSPDNPKPGVVIFDNKLHGFKTWVASSRYADNLVISARRKNTDAECTAEEYTTTYWYLTTKSRNLIIHHKHDVRFLANMSQGIAEFTGLALEDIQQVHPGPATIRHFARTEPVFLYIAFCGFLAQRTSIDASVNASVDETWLLELLGLLLGVADGDPSLPETKVALAKADTEITNVMANIASQLGTESWSIDKSLISLYSPAIQRRAELALTPSENR